MEAAQAPSASCGAVRSGPPFYFCTSFLRCSVNACPLDPLYHIRPNLEDDDSKCRSQKPTRLRLVEELRAEGNPHVDRLPFAGLTYREEKRRKRAEAFAALPEDERNRRLERLAAMRQKQFVGTKAPDYQALQDSQAEGDDGDAGQDCVENGMDNQGPPWGVR